MATVINGTTGISLVSDPNVVYESELTAALAGVATDNELATGLASKANTSDLKEIGVGQTWQNVTASRAFGTTYTNTTGKPIEIAITGGGGVEKGGITIIVNGVTRLSGNAYAGAGSTGYQSGSIVVPNNSSYSATAGQGGTLVVWSELR